MKGQRGEQSHLAPLPLFCFPAWLCKHISPGLIGPVGKKFHMADERPSKGWASTYLQVSFTEVGNLGLIQRL